MKLEAGKYYKNRQGEIMGPLARSAAYGSNQFCSSRADGMGATVYWYESGHHMQDGVEDDEDLIIEIPTYPITPEKVNHPAHYNASGIECIDAIEAALTPEEFRGFIKANALKYIWREKHKGGDEDLKKAAWYLNRLIG